MLSSGGDHPEGMSSPERRSDPKARIVALDALRGFALCGIVIVNIWQTFHMADVPFGVSFFFHSRFFVIFSLLFGIGFGLFLDSAQGKSDRPRLLLVRRLAVLGAFGALHVLLQPGEVLWQYAAIGFLVLLPFSYAPRGVNLVVSLAFLAVGSFAGGLAVVPGLLLLGFALSAYGLPRTLPQRPRQLAALFVGFVGLSVLITWAGGRVGYSQGLTAGVPRALLPTVMSCAYMTGFLLLLHTPLGGALGALFAPLGRMALTNYLMATVLFVTVGRAIGLEGSAAWGPAIGLSAGILTLQAIVSPLWLRVFRYGPQEWIWRCATWAEVVPIRKEQPRGDAVAA